MGALLVALVAPATARAADHVPLEVALSTAKDRLSASFDLTAAFSPDLEKEFASGLTNVVAIFISLVPEEGGPPLVASGRVADVLYDVWEEAYAVTLRDARLQRPERHSVRDFAALRRLLGEAKGLDLGPAELAPAGDFHVEVRVEVNPVSRELMQRTRELLAHPATGRPGGGSRSVLGAVASYLLRDPDPGDDVVLFRSRTFRRGEVVR
jgi:hypothetical protein